MAKDRLNLACHALSMDIREDEVIQQNGECYLRCSGCNTGGEPQKGYIARIFG